MDWLTVGAVLGLLATGGGVVSWAYSYRVSLLKHQLAQAEAERDEAIEAAKATQEAATEAVTSERNLERARDLAPTDELGVLLLGAQASDDPPASDDPAS